MENNQSKEYVLCKDCQACIETSDFPNDPDCIGHTECRLKAKTMKGWPYVVGSGGCFEGIQKETNG